MTGTSPDVGTKSKVESLHIIKTGLGQEKICDVELFHMDKKRSTNPSKAKIHISAAVEPGK